MPTAPAPAPTEFVLNYKPHPKQLLAHQTSADEMLYGGAAGGGKSKMARMEHIWLAINVPGSRSVIFRKSFSDLRRAVEGPLRKEIPKGLATYNKQEHEFHFTNGSVIELAYLASASDLDNYQGAEYQLFTFEEGTQFTEDMYTYMRARLRSSDEVKARLVTLGLRERSIVTANPGGIGHFWVKRRFVDPYPVGGKVFRAKPTEEDPTPRTRVFIPARVDDNPSVGGDYIANLRQLPPERRRAWLEGDWNVIEGVRFSQWRVNTHIIRPEQLPITGLTGRRVIAVDYGFNAPFAAVWLCLLHDGMVVQYREAYETELTARQQAELIKELSAEEERITGERIPVVMDPSMWRRGDASAAKLSGGAPPPGSPAHAYQTVLGHTPHMAANARIPGWNVLDDKLTIREDGLPRYLVYETCRDTIRTIPALPRDKRRPDDVDTSAEDHIADALRYGLMWLEGQGGYTIERTPQPQRVVRGRGRERGAADVASASF